jgi:hypothetical protein
VVERSEEQDGVERIVGYGERPSVTDLGRDLPAWDCKLRGRFDVMGHEVHQVHTVTPSGHP